MKIKNYFEKNAFPIIVSTIVFGILLLTVGFSAFRQQLFITGMFADVRVPADIRVTGISPNGNKNDGVSNSEDYNVKNISGNITLPNSDSSITYRVEVTNFEGPEMGIFDLTGLPDNLEYTLEEYELKEKICENDRCTLGVKKSFNITIQYKENGYDSENQTFNFKLDFDFRSYHKVRYEGLTYSDTYPQEVMDRDTLEFDFNNNEKITNLKVTVDEVNNTSFTLEGQKFTLENVTGDVVIQTATTKTTAFIEFMKEQTTKDDRDFDFHNPDAIENGVFLHYETIDDEYPIYYYRGDVENHLIYANHCWQIVRTSEQGGLKIVYDGKTSGGQCNDSRDRLGSEPYNEKPNNLASPSQVGYMYGEIENILTISPSRLDDLMQKDSLQDITNIIKEKMTTETTIIAGASVSWNGTTYEIQSYKTYTDDTPRMLFKNAIEDNGDNNRYTCLSNSTTCDTVYYHFFN